MKRILGGLLLSALFLLGAPYSSYAAPCGCGGTAMREGGTPMWRMGHGMEMGERGHLMWRELGRLGLDKKQQEAARDIRSRLMRETISKMADVRIARLDLKDMLARDSVDMQAVEAKLKEIGSLQTTLRLSRIKAMLQVKALLTPQQSNKLREDLEKYRGPEKFQRRLRRDGDGSAEEGAMR